MELGWPSSTGVALHGRASAGTLTDTGNVAGDHVSRRSRPVERYAKGGPKLRQRRLRQPSVGSSLEHRFDVRGGEGSNALRSDVGLDRLGCPCMQCLRCRLKVARRQPLPGPLIEKLGDGETAVREPRACRLPRAPEVRGVGVRLRSWPPRRTTVRRRPSTLRRPVHRWLVLSKKIAPSPRDRRAIEHLSVELSRSPRGDLDGDPT